MIIKQAGTKRTDHEVMPFKGLMDWRRLMYPAGDRFKVVNAKRKGITTTVPANDIKRMMPVMNAIHPALLFRLNEEIPLFINSSQPLGAPDIPFTIGRMFQQLAIGAQVFFGITDRAKGFDDKQPVIRVVKMDLVNSPPRYHQVIPITEIQLAIKGLQHPTAPMNKDHLIGIRIFVKIIFHTALRRRQYNMAVAVHQHRLAALQVIGGRGHLEPLKATGLLHLLFSYPGLYIARIILR